MYPQKLAKSIITVIAASTLFLACLLSACFTRHVHDLQYVAAAEATCEENGNAAYYVCSCGKYFSDADALTEIAPESTIIPRKSHTFTAYGYDENVHYSKCAVCGFVKSNTEAEHILKYYADEYAHYRYCVLCGYRTESEPHVPDEEGEEFCKICRYRRPNFELSADGEYYICTGATQAFKDLITELIIPDTYLELPVKEVSARAFSGCPNLETVTLGKNVISIGDYAFMDNLQLKTVAFNEGLLEIGASAFYGCKALEEVVLPPNLMTVGSAVFRGCTNLKKVNIPQSLKSVSAQMFYECYALETVELHDGITSFGYASFERSGISEFTVPDGVTSVPLTMFLECENLEIVTLPESITSIGSGVFMDCPALKKIIFCGSKEQWDSISFADMWDRNSEFEIEFLK